MNRLVLLTMMLVRQFAMQAQPYIEGGNTRHRFAQLTIGADIQHFLAEGSSLSYLTATGSFEEAKMESQTATRLIIGGTHFWGHADFYVAVPIASFGKSGLGTGAETGARVFPWRIQHNKLRPFAGMAWVPNYYQQGDGVKQFRHNFPITAGIVFNSKKHLLELSGGYNYQNKRSYHITVSDNASIRTQPFWISAGYKYMLETTASAEESWVNGRAKYLTDTLGKLGRLNGFTVAAGVSSAMFLKESSHNESAYPYLDHHKVANTFPEFAAGYYMHKPDLQINLAYRGIKNTLKAYGLSQKATRHALTLEACKFLLDYHGFAAFLGGSLSHEWLSVKEEKNGLLIEKASKNKIAPGLTFGWDIRPNRLQLWYLRTTLRWFPCMEVTMKDAKPVSFDQLEFNFIQFVIFPDRIF